MVARQPNILLVTCEHLRCDTPGCRTAAAQRFTGIDPETGERITHYHTW